jgi:hypothetical protein
MFLFLKNKKVLGGCFVLSFLALALVAKAEWTEPTSNPPGNNQARPINQGIANQDKTGILILSNQTAGLIMSGQAPLLFGPAAGPYVGFKASTTIPGSDVVWSLPITDGVNGSVLTTDGNKNLKWTRPEDLITQDEDWTYQGTSPNYTSITSRFLTKVNNILEVNGRDSSANAEIDIKSGTNNHWGLYQENSDASLKFWNGNNRMILTRDGKLGVGIFPEKTLDVAGDIKLSGLIYDSFSSTGSTKQLLSSNGTGVKWIDPAWWPETGFVYSTQNTRVGSGGTINQANGAGDLYVQNKLEVDGLSYLNGVQTNGNIIPTVNSTYDLGSPTNRWRNIYVDKLNLGAFTQGSVIFQGADGFDQNNANFFWDNTNKRLGLGLNTPTQALEIKGNLALTEGLYDGTSGVITLGGKRFIFGSGKSLYPEHYTGQEEYSNVYIGSMAGNIFADNNDSFNQYVTDNTGVGFHALNNFTGWSSTALGSYALSAGSTGGLNTAIGINAMMSNTIGSYTTAVGANSLYSNIDASYVAALGSYAGYSNTIGDRNVFVGALSGYYNTTGSKNVFLGYRAGINGVSGTENVFLGNDAGYNNNGAGNVFLGSGAGNNNTTGSGNIFIGAKAGFYESGSYKFYVDPSNASGDNALIYGNFYSAASTNTPSLRFNGNVGIAPRGTANFASSKLLHLYQPSGSNAELDIQSYANDGTGNAQQRQWAIYQDRTTRQLRFWNAFAGLSGSYGLNNDYNNILILSDLGKVGIGIRNGEDPTGKLEIHSVSENVLTLSSYDAGFTAGGGNIIDFIGVKTGGGRGQSAQLATGFSGSDSDPYNNAFFKLKLPSPVSGSLADKAVFNNNTFTFSPTDRSVFSSKVNVNGVHSNNPRTYDLAVTGSIHGDDYYSGGDRQGGTAYICTGRATTIGMENWDVRYEDGLYICSCLNNPTNRCGTCTCGN